MLRLRPAVDNDLADRAAALDERVRLSLPERRQALGWSQQRLAEELFTPDAEHPS